MCAFFKVDLIAVASASQSGKPERLTLWALLFCFGQYCAAL